MKHRILCFFILLTRIYSNICHTISTGVGNIRVNILIENMIYVVIVINSNDSYITIFSFKMQDKGDYFWNEIQSVN